MSDPDTSEPILTASNCSLRRLWQMMRETGYVWQMITDQSGWQIDQRKGDRVRRKEGGGGVKK